MKIEFSLIGIILILVLSIGAVSAADIDNATDSDSVISVSSPVDLSVENDGSGYVDDDIDTNDSDSFLLGVSGDEDLIGDGQLTKIEFKDAVDGVIIFNESNPDYGDYDSVGFRYNVVYFLAYDENGDIITLDETNSDFDFNGNPWNHNRNPWRNPSDDYQGVQLRFLNSYSDSNVDLWDGTYILSIYNADRTFSQNVTIVLYPPRKVEATISVDENVTVEITTNDAPGNFTIYYAGEEVANGKVNESGMASASFEKIIGTNTVKIVLDGKTTQGLTYEKDVFIPAPGMFSDLSSMIANNDVVNLTYNIILDPYEANLLKDGIIINKNVTINGNGYTINGTDLVRIFYIKDNENANVILRNLTITGGLATFDHGGAIYLRTGSLTIENCTFVANTLKNSEAHGGAIHASERTTLTIKDSVFENNTDVPKDAGGWRARQQYGGAIYCSDYVNLNVTNTLFKGNKAINNNFNGREARAGAIYSVGSNSNNNIINCTFINNTADNGVGAIQTRIANIIGCIFDDNYADNDWPTIYFEGDGKGTISYNIFFDNTTQIRLRDNYANVAEEYNWYATNEPDKIVRLNDQLSTPNKYLMLDVYNEGTTVKAGLMKDSSMETIPDINALPLRTIKLTGDVNETEPALIDGVATVTYTSEITSESIISATIDGYTVNYTLALGNITNINVIYVENTTVGKNGTVLIYLLGDNGAVDGNLAIYLNDTKFEVAVANGVATLNAGYNFNGGIYDISYIYLGSANYVPSRDKVKSDSKFEIEKNDVNITYSIDKDGWITIKVTDEINPTGSVKMVIDDSITRNYGTSVRTNLPNLAEGTHTINLTYGGDSKHNPKTLSDTFEVIKMIPPCNITQDGGKFTFDFTTALAYKGSVTVDFVGPNSFSENLYNLPNTGIVSVDVTKKLQNGSYNLTVHFSSSSYGYASADFNYSFDVLKHKIISMTVSPEEPTKTVNTVIPVTVTITVEDGYPIPTGKVSFPTGGQASTANLDENGVAIINWANRADKLGPELKNITYEGDINYDPCSIEVTFICTPAPLDIGLTSNGNNVTLTFNDKYGHDNNGVVHIYDYDEYLGNVTGNDGFPEFKVDNLDSGVHYFNVVWQNNNGNNYTSSKSFVLRTPGTSQWVTTGFDNKNSGNPDYIRPVDDVYVLWSNDQSINITEYPNNIRKEYSGEITRIVEATYSPLISSDGLIFLNDGYLVYVYDTDGNVLFSKAPGRKVPGIGLYNDSIVMAERTDDEIVIYDFITGQSYSGEFSWVSCSMFYPVEGPDGRVYIVSEYNNMNNGGNWITVIAYSEEDWWSGNHNKFNWNDAYIDTEAIAPPVFDDEGNMWVATKGGIRAVNIYSGAKIFSDSKISTNARPAVSESNIVFYLSKETENSLYALTAEGYLWNTTVSGTVGTTLAIDNENGFVYSVNKEGTLYKYDINDGTETFVYDLGAKAKSIIVDGDSKVYVGDTNGYVTALDSEGNLLWTINLGAPIAGGLAMNNEGIIYAYTNDTLFALGYRDLISIEVSIPAGNYTALDEVTITATLNETVEGTVTFTAGDLIQVVAVNGTTAEWTTALPAGEQTVSATFEGDGYVTATGTATVNIAKVDAEITADAVSSIKKTTITLTLPKNATGKVSVKVNGKSYSTEVEGGTAVITITDLKSGKYTAEVTYGGDDNYNNASFEVAINVPYKENLTISASADLIVVGEDAVIVVSGLKDATGNVTVSVNGKTYAAPINGGTASVIVSGLTKSVTASVSYAGDAKYNSASTSVAIVVNPKPKENATISIDAPVITEGESATVTVTLPSDATGRVTIGDKVVPIRNGVASAVLTNLPVGNNNVPVTYSGDDKYNSIETSVVVTVNAKPVPTKDNLTISASADLIVVGEDAVIVVSGLKDATGNVTVNVNGKTYTAPINGGTASVIVSGLTKSVTASVSYAGDDKYNAASTSVVIVVNPKSKENATISIDAPEITEGESATVTVTLPGDATGSVTIGDKVVPVKNGIASAVLANLPVGNNKIPVTYSGDDKYNSIETSTVVTVKEKPVPPKENLTISASADAITVGEDAVVVVSGLKDATGNVVVSVNGKSYTGPINRGSASVKIPGLTGNVTAAVSYAGDAKYNAASTSVVIVVNPKSKENATISIDAPSEATEGDNVTVTVTLPGDATGSVTIGNEVVPIRNGVASAVLTNLPVGNNNVPVTYSGDNKYNSIETSTVVTVKEKPVPPKENLTINAVADPITVGEDAVVVVSGLKDATGNVVVTVNGKSYTGPIVKGVASVKVSGLTGTVTAAVSYAGDAKYNAASASVDITVNPKAKENATMNIAVPPVTEGQNTIVNVELPKDATGNVTAAVGGKTYTAPVKDGKATITIPDLAAGNYNVPVTYSGDDKYNPLTEEIKITVDEDKSDIIKAPDVTKYFNGPERFVVTVTDYQGKPLANKSVTIVINGVTYNRKTNDNGTTSVALGLSSGVYNATVTVDKKTVNSVVTILSTSSGNDITKVFRNGTQYYATFRDSQGNYLKEGETVRFNINGVMYDRKISGDKGLAKLNINLEAGEYIITAMNLVTGDKSSNTITVLSKITENADLIKYYRNSSQYTVKVLGSDGKAVGTGESVTFNINGVFYTRQTDANGIAKLNINLNPGDYIITAEYNGCKVSNNIKVLPVLTGKDLTKKFGEPGQFEATLVDGQGKAYANQKISFNINGVFYERTTNANGIAKLNINLQPGVYIITSTYGQAAISNKVTVTA